MDVIKNFFGYFISNQTNDVNVSDEKENTSLIQDQAKTVITTECLKEFEEVLEQITKNKENADSIDKKHERSLDDLYAVLDQLDKDNATKSNVIETQLVDLELFLPQFRIDSSQKTINAPEVIKNMDESQEICFVVDENQQVSKLEIISISSEESIVKDNTQERSSVDIEELTNYEGAIPKGENAMESDNDNMECFQNYNSASGDVIESGVAMNDLIYGIASDDDDNSSDFEFITEDEAKMNGIYIRKKTDKLAKSTDAEKDKGKNMDQLTSGPNVINPDIHENAYINPNSEIKQSSNEQIPGPSVPKTANPDPRILRWSNYQRARRQLPFVIDNSYRQNHRVRTGNEYAQLFDGNSYPHVMGFLGNKSVRALQLGTMQVEYAGIGFDRHMRERSESEDVEGRYYKLPMGSCLISVELTNHQTEARGSKNNKVKEEAEKTTKRIIDMYPAENRKRRRRH